MGITIGTDSFSQIHDGSKKIDIVYDGMEIIWPESAIPKVDVEINGIEQIMGPGSGSITNYSIHVNATISSVVFPSPNVSVKIILPSSLLEPQNDQPITVSPMSLSFHEYGMHSPPHAERIYFLFLKGSISYQVTIPVTFITSSYGTFTGTIQLPLYLFS